MQSIKLLFFLAVWRRPEITEICFMGLNRLKKTGLFLMEFFAVISEESMIPLCEQYGVQYVMHENFPLGAKKNFGLREALKLDFDYMVEIGSDDLLKNEFLSLYSFDRDVLALSEFLMLNTADGECRKLTKRDGYYGVGRAISRRALEAIVQSKGGLWVDKLNCGLDNNSMFSLAKKGFLERRVTSPEPVVIDLKSDVNIWPFQKKGQVYSLEKALSGLSEDEINAIQCLLKESESLTEG